MLALRQSEYTDCGLCVFIGDEGALLFVDKWLFEYLQTFFSLLQGTISIFGDKHRKQTHAKFKFRNLTFRSLNSTQNTETCFSLLTLTIEASCSTWCEEDWLMSLALKVDKLSFIIQTGFSCTE